MEDVEDEDDEEEKEDVDNGEFHLNLLLPGDVPPLTRKPLFDLLSDCLFPATLSRPTKSFRSPLCRADDSRADPMPPRPSRSEAVFVLLSGAGKPRRPAGSSKIVRPETPAEDLSPFPKFVRELPIAKPLVPSLVSSRLSPGSPRFEMVPSDLEEVAEDNGVFILVLFALFLVWPGGII